LFMKQVLPRSIFLENTRTIVDSIPATYSQHHLIGNDQIPNIKILNKVCSKKPSSGG
jgi:hypothetical protein